MKKQHYRWIDLAKGLVMFLVIYEHTSAYNWRIVSLLCSFAMPFYFFISGVLASSMVNDRGGQGESIIRRGKRLLIPHFVYGFSLVALTGVIDLLEGNGVGNLKLNLIGVVYGRTMIYNTASRNDPSNIQLFQAYDGTLWFLLAMFLVYVLFCLVVLHQEKSFKWLLTAVLIMISGSFCFLPILLPWSMDTIGVLVVFMLAGFKLKDIISKLKIIPSMALGLFCLVLCYFNQVSDISVRLYGRFGVLSIPVYILIGLSGSLCMCGIARSLIYSKRLSELMFIRFAEFVGRNSLTFMCTQILVIGLTGLLLGRIITNRYAVGAIEFVCCVIICAFISGGKERLKKKHKIFSYL